MKKYLLLLLLLIPVFGISQSLLDSIQIKIQHLNHANIPSNILYERTFQKANLVAFSSEMEGSHVDVSNLKPGIYFIKAIINNEITTKKIIKK